MIKPKHLAIIMDGNGRWAKARGRTRAYGHAKGAKAAREIITTAVEAKIEFLTLYAFSTENWYRPETEVAFLMKLLRRQILKEQTTLMKNNVQFKVIGDIARLPAAVRSVVEATVRMTANNSGMTLVFALSYGGRQEIISAVQKIAEKVSTGELSTDEIDLPYFASQLESSFLPDPDMIIRTSGEKRISNFFLWQSAYTEFYLVDKPWPDFTAEDFHSALHSYAERERRFGRISVSPKNDSDDRVTGHLL